MAFLKVLTLRVGELPARPALPAASVYLPASTVMLAATSGVSAKGVNTAVRVRPVPEMALSVPCVTKTSPVVPSHAKVLPGSSLKVKVMLAVWPMPTVDKLDVMTTVGTAVS